MENEETKDTETETEMKIVEVIPISRGVSKEILSYFSSQDGISPGALVSVPLRNKEIPAIVASVKDARSKKTELRSSTFSVRKISAVRSKRFLRESFLRAVEETARYFAGTTGSVLDLLVPKTILEEASLQPADTIITPEKKPEMINEKIVIQADNEERFANYKSLIRGEFAKKKSVFFCLPTIEDIRHAKSTLEKGIEPYTVILHGTLKKSELLELWKAALHEQHPLLIIATSQFLSLPRTDIGTIIIENESSRAYKFPSRPFVDARVFAGILSREMGARLVLGDIMLSTETVWRYKNGSYLEFTPLKFRSLGTAKNIFVDMRAAPSGSDEPAPFTVLSAELKELVKRTKEESENLFLFCSRKGLYPTVVCGDCGDTVLCGACGAPLVLHSSRKENYFLCHTCGERRSSHETCKRCGGWKLTPLGVGIELVEKELRGIAPGRTILRLDKDSAPTHKKASAVAEEFYKTPGSVLLGTEMSLPFLGAPIDAVAIGAIDSLFAIPDFRIHERILSILLRTRSLAQKYFLIQTRNAEEPLFDYALKGNLINFYREETRLRKQFGYPPFSLFIKISRTGEKETVERDMKELETICAPEDVHSFPALIKEGRGKFMMHALIKVDPETWPKMELVEKLRALPPKYTINVSPESLL